MFTRSSIRNAYSNVIGLARPSRLTLLATLLLGGLSLNSCSTFENEEVKPADATASADAYKADFNSAKGVNIQFSYNHQAYKDLDFVEIRRKGFTAVRIEIDPERVDVNSNSSNVVGKFKGSDVVGFGRVVDYVGRARKANLDVVLTYHNTNYMGKNSPDYGAATAGVWWTKAIPKLKYYAYTINVINEWGRDTRNGQNRDFVNKWVNGYSTAISKIHTAGYRGPIIVDASNYAQDVELLLNHGKDISTKGHRIIFSVHIYPDAGITAKNLADLNAKYDGRNYNYGMIVGEFGSKYNDGKDERRPIVEDLVKNAAGKGFGVFGWSWVGDGRGMNAKGNDGYRHWIQRSMGIKAQ